MRISIRHFLILTTIVSVPIAIYAKSEHQRIQAERRNSLLQLELEATQTNLENGLIHVNQLVVDYIAMADPCESEDYGRYSEFQHGFPGGLGHGVTIISKDGRLMKAYSWSCMGGTTYFNGMTDTESAEFGRLWSWANPPGRLARAPCKCVLRQCSIAEACQRMRLIQMSKSTCLTMDLRH